MKPFETFGGEINHSELAHVQKKKKKVEMLGIFKEMKWHKKKKKSVYAWQSAMETDLLWNHEVHVTLTEASAHTEQKQVSFQINVVEQQKCNITCKIPPNEKVKYNTALE